MIPVSSIPNGYFSRLAKVLLCAGALALLLAVIQLHRHNHDSSAGSHSEGSCVVCKANNNFGGVPTISVIVPAFIPVETVAALVHPEPAHAIVIPTSGLARAPPHSA